MPTRASPWLVALGVMLLSIGCRTDDSTTPVDGHRELCCRVASPDNVSFTGCRATSHCRANEEIWVRGPVTCGAADPQACGGGRCCKLDLEAVETPALEAPTEPSAEPSAELERAQTQAPAPAAISPIPLGWRATPTAITIPKLVCPAEGEGELEGTVVLGVDVGADGRVREVEVRRGFDPRCDALARDALLHAVFEPARSPVGEPIPATLTWPYQFGGE
jgi:TonB family protein